MGRAANKTGTTASAAARRGIDVGRLLSTSNPLVSGRDVAATAGGAVDRMNVEPPQTGEDVLAAEARIGSYLPSEYRHTAQGYTQSVNFLASGDAAHKVRTGAPYRGHIGIRTDPQTGARALVAFCTFGKEDGEQHNEVYCGTDLKTAVKKVNAKMQSKVREGRGLNAYEPASGDPQDAKLTEAQVIAAVIARDPAFGGTATS